MLQAIKYILVKLYSAVWVSVYYMYLLQAEVRSIFYYTWKLIVQKLLSCWPPYSQHADLANLAKITKTFAKIPKHIAISVVENETETLRPLSYTWNWIKSKFLQAPDMTDKETENTVNDIDLQSLAKVITWAWASHIPLISLYDINGRLKSKHRELGFFVQEEILQNFWALKEYCEREDPPVVKFHNVSKLNGYTNGINGTHSPPPLDIVIFSHDDGKDGVIRAAKEIVKENVEQPLDFGVDSDPDKQTYQSLYSLNNAKKLNYESKIDNLVNRVQNLSNNNKSGAPTDPDLLVILGNIKSTLGFLPWHIRLTEMHWLPNLFRIQIGDFQDALWKFSRCQQRFGT